MRFTLAILLALFCHSLAAAPFPAVIPVTNDHAWRTDVTLHNVTDHVIQQLIGSLTYRNGDKSTVLTETLTLNAGETTVIEDLGSHWDAGDRVLTLEPGIAAVVFLHFLLSGTGCHPAFELNALTSALVTPGTSLSFDLIRVDDAHGLGTFPTMLNTGTADVAMTVAVYRGAEIIAESFVAPPGISQVRVHTQLPNGGRIAIFLGFPGFGGASVPPVYPFVAAGPLDGGTQAIRYGQ